MAFSKNQLKEILLLEDVLTKTDKKFVGYFSENKWENSFFLDMFLRRKDFTPDLKLDDTVINFVIDRIGSNNIFYLFTLIKCGQLPELMKL